jgi:hypothetical protein
MTRLALATLALALAACGGGKDGGGGDDGTGSGSDNGPPQPLDYTDPAPGGALRLVENRAASTPTSVALDLIVGDSALTGYSTGINLPLAPGLVKLSAFRPGTALPAGAAPAAAQALVPTSGPLAGVLVAAQSQKASGEGAVPTDTKLDPGAVLLSLQLDLVDGAAPGAVFDGTAPGFALPSGGLRDRAGLTVVEPKDVALGKLAVNAR